MIDQEIIVSTIGQLQSHRLKLSVDIKNDGSVRYKIRADNRNKRPKVVLISLTDDALQTNDNSSASVAVDLSYQSRIVQEMLPGDSGS
jgi:hypothetical protein